MKDEKGKDLPSDSLDAQSDADLDDEKLSPTVRRLLGVVTADGDPIEEYRQYLIEKYSR